jgi:copper chaperone CopZ
MLVGAINNKQFNNFEIIQNIKQQLCIKVPCLYREPERARIFEMLLCKREAITSAKVSPDAASAAIQFDAKKLPLENLFLLLDSLLENIGYKVNTTLQQIKSGVTTPTFSKYKSSFLINGLKCESCAISLEMAINRHPTINKAHVDFESTTLKIQGNFSDQEIINLVNDAGFELTPQ